MKKIYKLLLFAAIILLSASTLFSQSLSTKNHLEQLKEGVLLVKLYTRSNTIEALKQAGSEVRAGNLEKDQNFKNMAIASAFELHYNFTPKVYFFYSDDSRKIKNRDFEGVLMGYDLQDLDNIEIKDQNFYVAEFGNTEGKNIRALVVRDDSLNYMEAPFPYFVRTFEGFLFFERPYAEVVKMWNEKLKNKLNKINMRLQMEN